MLHIYAKMIMTQREYLEELAKEKHNRRNKYGARKIQADGMVFDSTLEYERYCELRILQKAGEISGLERQKSFELIPAQKDKDGKVLERACTYRADFCYTTKDGEYVVEDTKGFKTPEYKIKRKLMLFVHNIRIHEIH